jgi:RHS repeat-associated protein
VISQKRGTTTSYYLPDVQSSTRLLTSSAAAVTDTYRYSAFGDIETQTGTTTNSYLYTGQQFDSSTGLYSLRARYYDAAVGRFLSRDTWAIDRQNPMELNRYVYAAGNPVRWGDPSGHLIDFGLLLSQIREKLSALGSLGTTGATLYIQNMYLTLIRFMPIVPGVVCFVAGLSTEADLDSACQGPLDEFAQSARTGLTRFARIVEGSVPQEQATLLLRWLYEKLNWLRNILFRGLPSLDVVEAVTGTKNIGNADWIVEGLGNMPRIWGISGFNGQVTQTLEYIIRLMSRNGDEIARYGDQIISQIINRTHSEGKILGYILDEIQRLNPSRGTQITIRLFTERQPCTGCQNGIAEFRRIVEDVLELNLDLEIIFRE